MVVDIRQHSSTTLTRFAETAMHKLQFARGIGQREFLRANTLPSLSRTQIGCFARIHLYEVLYTTVVEHIYILKENARLILLALLLIAYMLCGAVLFRYLERDNEIIERQQYAELYRRVQWLYCADYTDTTRYINCTMLVCV